MRVSFTLSMPNSPSWNGQWSGKGRNYQVVKNLSKKTVDTLKLNEGTQYFSHRWDDGWRASIEVKLMEKGERKLKSDGFCGYNWMINNIIDHQHCEDT